MALLPQIEIMERMLTHYGEMLIVSRQLLARASDMQQRQQLQEAVQTWESVIEHTRIEIERARKQQRSCG